MSFQEYKFQDLSAPPNAKITPRYDEPKLIPQKDIAHSDASHRQNTTGHFALDSNVASNLGIYEREHAEAEVRIKKEMDRRWEQMAEKAEVDGYTRGLEEGKTEAFKAEMPRIAEKLEAMDRMLQEMDSMRDRIFQANEAFLMNVVSQVAGMVALKAVEADPEYTRRLITTLMHQLATKDDLKIYLAESDLHNVEVLRAGLEKEFGKLTNTTIEAAPDVQSGGCKIETRFGVVDASLVSQVNNAIKSLNP